MKARHWKSIGITALAVSLLSPGAVDAQLGRIDVGFDLGRDRGLVTYQDGRLGIRYQHGWAGFSLANFVPVNGVRIPRGFRPAPGMCRLWAPGLPPGHQPRPVPCGAIDAAFGGGVLLVTHRGVLRPVWDRSIRRHWRGYRDARIAVRDPRGLYWYDRNDVWWDDRYDDWDDRYDWDDRWGDDWDDDWDGRWEDRRDRERDRAERWRERSRERDERGWDRRDDRRDRGRAGRGNGRGNGRGVPR